jgi:hypothetical protein
MTKIELGDYSPLFAPFVNVETFMLAAGHLLEHVWRDSRPIDYERFTLYMKFVNEEYMDELVPASMRLLYFKEKEQLTPEEAKEAEAVMTEVVDGLFDLIWVTIGAMLALGIPVRAIWEEGARSNLDKIDPLTKKVIKREDGKILKPEGWTPPDFHAILKAHFKWE